MEAESRLFRYFLIIFVSVIVIIGVVYGGLLVFNGEAGVFRRVLYNFIPNFRAAEIVVTLVPNPNIIDGYFLNDLEKNPTHRVSNKWIDTYTNNKIVSSTRTGISPSYHKDLVYFAGTVSSVDSKRNTVDIVVQGDRYSLNLRPYTYYYKYKGDANLKPVGRLTDVKLLEIGKIGYFLIYDGGKFLTVINVEL